MFLGSIDGKIKRWDLSGEGKKKEIEIVKTVEKNDNNSKKSVGIDSISPNNNKNLENIENEKKFTKFPRRRFIDFYFEDAIIAEEQRKKAAAAGGDGKLVFLQSVNIFFVNFISF